MVGVKPYRSVGQVLKDKTTIKKKKKNSPTIAFGMKSEIILS